MASFRKLAFILFATTVFGCKSKYIHKDDLIGIYKIDKFIPVDSTAATLGKINKVLQCTLTLEEHDNFSFSVNEKGAVGYWAFTENANKKNEILFQSGYLSEKIIYAQFDDTSLYFSSPIGIMDSVFKEVLLKRVDK